MLSTTPIHNINNINIILPINSVNISKGIFSKNPTDILSHPFLRPAEYNKNTSIVADIKNAIKNEIKLKNLLS